MKLGALILTITYPLSWLITVGAKTGDQCRVDIRVGDNNQNLSSVVPEQILPVQMFSLIRPGERFTLRLHYSVLAASTEALNTIDSFICFSINSYKMMPFHQRERWYDN